MRFVSPLVLGCVLTAVAQQPVALGPGATLQGGVLSGALSHLYWWEATPSGCSAGSGACVGHTPQGDFHYFTAWLPNASGLPVKSGLPVVGTLNDYTFAGCSGNVATIQIDKFSWSAPNASHITMVNCMGSFGVAPSQANMPIGWNGHLTSGDAAGGSIGTWKSRAPFSKGGILYLPVERQIAAGASAVHDSTIILSPDSGAHWCNPYTWANHAGGPGCDSSNWQADGDAPKCGSTAFNTPCTDAGYTDPSHSSIMWKAIGVNGGAENWAWINFANQDGQPFPAGAGAESGCDPATYTCFMLLPGDGSIGRVPNASILDISAWQYYSCPAISQTYRCPGTDPGSWTSNFANRTTVVALTYTGDNQAGPGYINPYTVTYLKEFQTYVMTGGTATFASAPTLQGPWQVFSNGWGWIMSPGTIALAPALGYAATSNPPSVQITEVGNRGGQPGNLQFSPELTHWNFVLGKQYQGEAFQRQSLFWFGGYDFNSGAGYQFSTGNIIGAFPRKGVVWSFDLHDARPDFTNWPSFMDRANYSAVVTPCDGTYSSPVYCGRTQAFHGTSVGGAILSVSHTGYSAHFRVAPADFLLSRDAGTPAAMLGNGSYTVIGVYRLNGISPNHWMSGIWATGQSSSNDNSMVELDQSDGKLVLNWGAPNTPHYQYISNFTLTQGNWYFVAATVRAQNACGSDCTPAASIWVGGIPSAGVLTDALAGVGYTNATGTAASTRTPNVQSGPFVLGMNPANDQGQSSMSFATVMIYDRALAPPEVQLVYRALKAKMKLRGVILQ